MLQLEVVGAVTNGGAGDLAEAEQLGFQLFAPAAVVGHAHIRWVEINEPVQVGALVVYPGDLHPRRRAWREDHSPENPAGRPVFLLSTSSWLRKKRSSTTARDPISTSTPFAKSPQSITGELRDICRDDS